MPQNPLLFLVALPAMAGILCLAVPDRLRSFVKAIAVLAALAVFAVSIQVFVKKPLVMAGGSGAVFVADNLSAFVALAIALFGLLVALYSSSFIERSFGRYYGYLLITLACSLGAAFANNLIILTVFWGALAALLFLMVNLSGTDRAAFSAKKALIMIGGTDALLVFGIALVWSVTGTFSMDKINLPLNSPITSIAYICIAIAALTKAGAMPFHSWLPDVAQDAPAPVAAYLPASVDKLLGIYLLARVSLDLFVMNKVSNFVLLVIGAATIIFAVIFALVQHDLKRLLGYHAVSQVGYMVLGIGTGNAIGIAGGLFHMLNNAVYKSCLFMGGGAVEKRTHTTDLSRLGGLSKFMPVTFVCFLIASLSISGIPPFNGFVSKWMIYQGIIELAGPDNPMWIVWLLCAMFGSALTIASFMKLLHAVFLGRSDNKFNAVVEAGFPMTFPMAVLAAICVIFGIFSFVLPLPILIGPAVPGAMVFIGLWRPVLATVLIAIGIAVGLAAYGIFRKSSFRTTKVFIGGEDPGALMRVSGTEFYDTVRDMKTLGKIYRKEEAGSLDIYNISKKVILSLTGRLQLAHNGILPTYMVWCLLGMIAMFLVLFLRKSW